MNMNAVLAPRSRVTVIDDDEDGRDEIMDDLRDFQFDPSAVDGRFDDRLDDMLEAIEKTLPDFVICDNRLQARQMAQFHGVSVVKALVARRTPAMLLTMYGSSDRLQLREARFDVPVIVARDDFSLDRLGDYYEVCQREIVANPTDQRRPHRTLIRIDTLPLGAAQQVDAVVPSWRPEHALPVPMSCIAPAIRSQLAPGMYLLGDVNIGARHEDELFFHNVDEIAPPPAGSIE